MCKSPRVVVLDYGSGNTRSAVRAAEKVGARVTLSHDTHDVAEADGLIVPGVGALGAVMGRLRAVDAPRLIDQRLAAGRPVFGICVGLQAMCVASTEHGGADGLGKWPGTVRRLNAPIVPHVGWSPVKAHPDSRLLAGLDGAHFYFVHSYALTETNGLPARAWASWAHHGEDFVAALEDGPLSATQFHPEKSADAGLALLENWTRSL